MKYINSLCRTALLCTFLITISCVEKCPDTVDIGTFKLSEKSKKIAPYQNGESQLIFKDQQQNSITFDVVASNEFNFSNSNWNEDCKLEDGKVKDIRLTGNLEWHTITLKPDSLGNTFNFHLKQEVNIDASNLDDLKQVDGITIYRNNVAQIGVVTDVKNSIIEESRVEEVAQIILNEKIFKDVVRSKFVNSGDLYYNLDKGIVAINEYYGVSKEAKFWVLDSVVFKK